MGKFYGMCLLLFTLSGALLSGCAGTDREVEEESGPVQETEDAFPLESEAPAAGIVFEGQDMEGNMVSSEIFSKSKLTMVNVWATYCNPCLSEMPGLAELKNEYDSEKFQIIGIISDAAEGSDQKILERAADLIDQTGADYPHLLLNESVYYAFLTDVTAVPTTFFIDENGTVLDTIVGAMEKSAWEEKINALLEGQ